MVKIFLLTAPFDEEAKTGDGQYAKSLHRAFSEHYRDIPCKWLKKAKNKYSIPYPNDATSLCTETIPSAMVLQPVSNEKTIISGYKLKDESSSSEAAQDVNTLTVSPRTPKVIVNHDNTLHSLTIMDIYTTKPRVLDAEKVKDLIESLQTKKDKLLKAISDNAEMLSKVKPKTKKSNLIKKYKENRDDIQEYCTLNEYLDAHLLNEKFLQRHQKALDIFEKLDECFGKPVANQTLEKLTDKLTGVKDYSYDFQSNSLPYEIICDNYDFDGLSDSMDSILKSLEIRQAVAEEIRQAVAERYENSFNYLNHCDEDSAKQLINLIYKDGFETYDEKIFVDALLDSRSIDKFQDAIHAYREVKSSLDDKKIRSDQKLAKKLIEKLQSIVLQTQEPYLSANAGLVGYYGKRKLTATEGFHLAYAASRRDPLKPLVIHNMIESMRPIDDSTFLDIHIRPPDCGVFINADDILRFQKEGIKVNVTIHEYKQNYTRRYLQQYTHDLMRVANTVQFFNALDRDNAVIAAKYGDCDKRNTTEPSGIAKKEREVGLDYSLEKFPVATYDLAQKSGLTVASQQLSTAPSEVKDVLEKEPNILSFGTIRPGKGFEEALILAKLVNRDSESIKARLKGEVPRIILAGDPQNIDLMQEILIERFGEKAVNEYQKSHPIITESTYDTRSTYWRGLINALDEETGSILNNPFLEIHPCCAAHELLRLKQRSKYVFRMDDMGMRNNGSAIISCLDVGIVYTKFGSVTDDIFVKAKGGKYGDAVDIGRYRYGKYSLEKICNDFVEKYGSDKEMPKLLISNPYSPYKRLPESRDPQEILDSIIAREVNQRTCDKFENSENYKTVLAAQKLLTEHFTLKKAAEHLLENIGIEHSVIAQTSTEQNLAHSPTFFAGSRDSIVGAGCPAGGQAEVPAESDMLVRSG